MNLKIIVGITTLILIILPHMSLGMIEEEFDFHPQMTLKDPLI